MSARAVWTVLIVAGLAVYLAISSLFVVSEGEQALVVPLGADRRRDRAGLEMESAADRQRVQI